MNPKAPYPVRHARPARALVRGALHVVAALAAGGSAQAQTTAGPTVTVYGFLKVDAEQVRAGAAGAAPATALRRLSSNLSVLGFRAQEDLGGGWAAWAQWETNVRVDTGDGPPGGRNSAVALQGPVGTLVLGQWETPLRFVSVYAVDPFTAGIFASNGILGNGFATAANGQNPASFDRRQPNLLQAWSPTWNGCSARIGHALSEERTDTLAPALWSGLVSCQRGGLYAAWGYERHDDYFYAGSRDEAHRLGLVWTQGATRWRAAWEQLRYAPTPGQTLARNAWQLALTHRVNELHELRASWAHAQRARGNARAGLGGIGAPGTDGGARQWSLGYGYRLSPRTELWAAATRVVNGATGMVNLSANPIPGLRPGQTLSGAGVGVTQSF